MFFYSKRDFLLEIDIMLEYQSKLFISRLGSSAYAGLLYFYAFKTHFSEKNIVAISKKRLRRFVFIVQASKKVILFCTLFVCGLTYHANKPTKPAVNNDTKIPANNIIGTYLDTKSEVFSFTIPFNVPIIIPIVEKLANEIKNVEITARR